MMDSFKLASLPLPRLRVAALLVIVRVVHVFLQLQAATAYGRGVQTSGGAIPSGFHLANGNGRVFDLPITVNLVFYGDWFDKSSKGKVEKARLEKFVTSLSDTGGTIKDWWQAVSKNYVGSNGPVSTKVSPTSKANPSRNQLYYREGYATMALQGVPVLPLINKGEHESTSRLCDCALAVTSLRFHVAADSHT